MRSRVEDPYGPRIACRKAQTASADLSMDPVLSPTDSDKADSVRRSVVDMIGQALRSGWLIATNGPPIEHAGRGTLTQSGLSSRVRRHAGVSRPLQSSPASGWPADGQTCRRRDLSNRTATFAARRRQKRSQRSDEMNKRVALAHPAQIQCRFRPNRTCGAASCSVSCPRSRHPAESSDGAPDCAGN